MSKQKKQQASAVKKAKAQSELPLAKDGQTKKVLHVGCGQKRDDALPKIFRGSEWQEIRLDIDPSVKPDIVSDIMDMKPVADNSVEAVFSSHNIEHVYAFQVQTVLGEFYRVIRPGGMVVITCPDLQAVAFHVAQGKLDGPLYQSPAGAISPQDIFYGHGASLKKGHHYMAHKCGFTAESLGRRLLAAGFREVIVERDNDFNLWARATKFPANHPQQRDDKITLKGGYAFQVISMPDVIPGKMVDELDIPPRLWKPLGLKNA